MVQTLAGSLALITSKEPLKVSIQQRLRHELACCELNEESKENLINAKINESLDQSCQLIKHQVVSRAKEDLFKDKQIIDEIEKRKNESIQHDINLEFLPERLRLNREGELDIYNELNVGQITNSIDLVQSH